MKKFLFIAIAALALWSSCTKTPSVSVGPISEEEVSASGGTVTVNVKSDGEWRTSADEGVVIEPSSGSGSQSVSIKVPANTSNDKKTITVTFYSVLGTSTQDVTILQQAPDIEVDQQEINGVPATGGEYIVNVTSAGGWTSTSSSDYTLSPSSYTGSDKKEVTIAVSKNTSKDKREIKVTFYSSLNHDKTQTVTIQQNSSSIIVEPQKFEDVPASGGTVDVYVTSDGDWGTTPDDGIGVKPSSGNSGTKMKVSITVPANTSSEDIAREVVFFSELNREAAQTVTIYQKAPSVSVKTMSNNVTAEGGTVEVKVTSDGGWKVKVPEDKGSYKVTPSEDSNSGTQSATITVYANTTKENRDVKVKFCSALNDDVSETVSISQDYIWLSAAPGSEEPDKVSVSGGLFKMTLISNGEWKTSIGDWTDSDGNKIITSDKKVTLASSGEGSKSAQTIEANVPANSSEKERSIQVKFYSVHDNSISSTVTICQKAPSISVTDPTENVPKDGGSVTVYVTSDGGWGTTLYSGATVDIAEYESSGTDIPVTITVPENTTSEERDIKVIDFYSLLNSTVRKGVTVHQETQSLSVTPHTAEVSASVGKVNVAVTFDGDWRSNTACWTNADNKQISTDDEITGVPFSGSGNKEFTITVPKNTPNVERYVKIRFSSKINVSVQDSIIIHQRAANSSEGE